MNAKPRSSHHPGPDPSLQPTREVDTVSSLAAELLLREQDLREQGRDPAEEESGERVRLQPRSVPPPLSLRQSPLEEQTAPGPARKSHVVTLLVVGLMLVTASAAAAFVLTR